jgi:indolepyruvate ferredoxin oxidoreductase
MTGLADAVARAYFKLLAYKDEYEVARLYTDGAFARELALQFQGKARLGFHLAPPLFAERDPATGHLKKREYGPWVMSAFRVVAALKGLRGTPFDVFGYAAERRMDRQLIAEYEAVLAQILAGLSPDNHVLAVEIAALPLQIRGFGHVKERTRLAAKDCETKLLTRFRGPGVSADAAE